MDYHIIYLEEEMLLSRKNYADWRQIQNEFKNYKASLGPWSDENILSYLEEEHPDLLDKYKEQLDSFFKSNQESFVLA